MPPNIVFARTVEKLRSYFARQGISASSDALATFLGCAVRPAAPAAIQAAVHAAMNPSAVAASGHAAGLLSRTIWTWPKAAAGFLVAGSITTAAVIAGHGAGANAHGAADAGGSIRVGAGCRPCGAG